MHSLSTNGTQLLLDRMPQLKELSLQDYFHTSDNWFPINAYLGVIDLPSLESLELGVRKIKKWIIKCPQLQDAKLEALTATHVEIMTEKNISVRYGTFLYMFKIVSNLCMPQITKMWEWQHVQDYRPPFHATEEQLNSTINLRECPKLQSVYIIAAQQLQSLIIESSSIRKLGIGNADMITKCKLDIRNLRQLHLCDLHC